MRSFRRHRFMSSTIRLGALLVTAGMLNGCATNFASFKGPLSYPSGIALDDALSRLALLDPRQARVVELRFFGGLDVPQTAEALGVAPATVKRDWAFARAWLARELSEGA